MSTSINPVSLHVVEAVRTIPMEPAVASVLLTLPTSKALNSAKNRHKLIWSHLIMFCCLILCLRGVAGGEMGDWKTKYL